MQTIIDTSKNIPLKARLEAEIKQLKNGRMFDKPLTEPSCSHADPPGLVRRTFKYRDERICVVRCHAQVMVALMEAMLEAPTLAVTATATSQFSGSYRTWKQQNDGYQAYLAGTGYKFANPCFGYHRRGRAFDLVQPLSERENEAMLKVRVKGNQFYNGASFGDPAHWSFGAKG